MRIQVNIPDELATAATKRGISPAAYVEGLIEQAANDSERKCGLRTPESLELFFDGMAAGSEHRPDLRTESFTRESFYEDLG